MFLTLPKESHDRASIEQPSWRIYEIRPSVDYRQAGTSLLHEYTPIQVASCSEVAYSDPSTGKKLLQVLPQDSKCSELTSLVQIPGTLKVFKDPRKSLEKIQLQSSVTNKTNRKGNRKPDNKPSSRTHQDNKPQKKHTLDPLLITLSLFRVAPFDLVTPVVSSGEALHSALPTQGLTFISMRNNFNKLMNTLFSSSPWEMHVQRYVYYV